jgi:small subunit ribosomal protein S8
MDSIGDFLTRIRNAASAGHRVVEVPSSKVKQEITKVLFDKGFLSNYKFETDGVKASIKIALKYNPVNKRCAILGIDRVSRPGLRRYAGVSDIPRVLNGLGIAILSTSKGIMTDKEAKDLKLGGEVICYVY